MSTTTAHRFAEEVVGGNGHRAKVVVDDWPEPPDEAAYYGLAGDAVRAIEPHTEADPVALLVQLLVGVGNAMGRHSYADADGARHHTNMNAALVGATAKGRKGTSWTHPKNLLSAVAPTWAQERILGGLSSGEGLIHAVRDAIQEMKEIRQKGEAPHYQLVEVDPGVEDKRLLCIEGEYASVIRQGQRDGNIISATMRQAWDGDVIQTLTKNCPGTSTGSHVSVIGHITIEELLKLLSSTDSFNGWANRHLWVCVRRSKCLPDGGQIHSVDFTDIHRRLAEAIEYGQQEHLLVRDADASALWHAVYPELSEGKPGLFGAVTSRAEAQVLRLSMIYALLDCSPWIRVEHLRAALAVWEYCERSCKHIFGNRTGDRAVDGLLTALRAAGIAGLARTEIHRLFAGHKNRDAIDGALEALEKLGQARRETIGTGGRPTERWYARED